MLRSFDIALEHSAAWLALIIPLALLLAWWLYFYKDAKKDWSKRLRSVLAFARWSVMAFLAFMLLMPGIIKMVDEYEKPRLLVYVDHSLSVNEIEKQKVLAWSDSIGEAVSDRYEFRMIPFGAGAVTKGSLRPLDSTFTDLGSVMNSVNEDFYGEHIGAVVIATDGIQNKGTDPRYIALNTAPPVFVLAMGDTSVRADIELSQLLNNKLVFLGNDFEIKARVVARKLRGKEVYASLYHNGKQLQRKRIRIKSSQYSEEFSFIQKATDIGLNKYSVEIDVLDEEVNKLNNAADAYIEVLDNRTSVHILAKAPHPDIAFYKNLIEENEQYEVSVKLLSDWDKNTDAADLYLLHGLPANANEMNLVNTIVADGKPTLTVLTQEVSILHFNAMELGVSSDVQRYKAEEAGAEVNASFNAFDIDKNVELKRYPPLTVPFGKFVAGGASRVILNKRIASIATDDPLMAVSEKAGIKHGVILGEGLWKWNLFEASIGKEESWTKKLVLKLVQYLAIKQKRTRLDVSAPSQANENEEVVFNAAYYNESYELSNTPNVDLKVINSEGKEFEYRFVNTANAYKVSLGNLPPGEYSWNAHVKTEDEVFTEKGVFTVKANRAEFINLVANHTMLEDLSERNKGEFYTLRMRSQLGEKLAELDSARPKIHSSRSWSSIIDVKWLLFVLVLLLAAEWFVRKTTGYV